MSAERVRHFDEPRPVEVLHDGAWIPGWMDGWVKWDDGWRASVTFTLDHEWGRGRYIRSIPADEVRPAE